MLTLSLPQPPIRGDNSHNGDRGDPHVNSNRSHCHHPYTYVTYDVLDTNWLGDPMRLRSSINAARGNFIATDTDDNGFDTRATISAFNVSHGNDERYAPGTLVWVLLSKGKRNKSVSNQSVSTLALHKKRRNKKNKPSLMTSDAIGRNQKNRGNSLKEGEVSDKHVIQNSSIDNGHEQIKDNQIEYSDNSNRSDDKKNSTDSSNHRNQSKTLTTNKDTANVTHSHPSQTELFLRARVVSDNENENEEESSPRKRERRVLVRYSKGATYRVRASNLIPGKLFSQFIFSATLNY